MNAQEIMQALKRAGANQVVTVLVTGGVQIRGIPCGLRVHNNETYIKIQKVDSDGEVELQLEEIIHVA